MPRVNGSIGLDTEIDPQSWRLRVVGAAGERAARSLALAEIRALPRVEMTTELKCIEGWSEVVHWAGTVVGPRHSNRISHPERPPSRPNTRPSDLLDYVSLETPDFSYYVGLDMASALHPQTLLCYEMGGALAPRSTAHRFGWSSRSSTASRT